MAGLLDGFGPQQYGGLLSDIQRLFQQPQQAAGAFNTPQASPSEPAFDMGISTYGGMKTPVFGQPPQQPEVSAQSRMPQAATPTAVPPPQAPQVGMGDRMRAGMEGFVENAHTGPLGAIMGGMMRGMSGTSGNETERALMARGLDKDTAKAVMKSPHLAPYLLGNKTQVINNRLVDARGNVVADFSDTKPPETKEFETSSGYKVPHQYNTTSKRWEPVPGFENQAAGTAGAAPVAQSPFSVPQPPPGLSKEAREAWDKKAGAETVERIMGAPQAQARAKEAIQTLFKTGSEALRLSSHPGLSSAVGPIQGRLPTFRDDTANFEADLGTLGSKLFINTINQMRELSKSGGAVGSVTEKEMMKLENAQRSLALTQSDGNMVGNMKKLVGDINDSMKSIAEAYKQQYGQDLPFEPIAVPQDAKKGSDVPRPSSLSEAAKLPKGTRFIDPSGIERVR